ncbi:hypothetical protein QE399_002774 [Paracidovorax wautersii]|uniref:Uncharacterized protein n=1 Tax=Paracidovorax wautersii TaxID=1177982 RepID=A0ABU1ICX5_9BURK|nr:hypothetical protein [Paracidovorax wautersii]
MEAFYRTGLSHSAFAHGHKKARALGPGFSASTLQADQWNCSSSVEPVSAFTLEEPPWITVVTSSK